jgi:large subunit ribosomal protein L13
MKKTFAPKLESLKPSWHFLDANDKILGKVAAQAAKILAGKNSAMYTPNTDLKQKVVITNAEKVILTGTKMDSKEYNRYTGFPGGLKTEKAGKLMVRRPTEVLKRAISGMLPKNKLRKARLTNLYIYAGAEHPHQGQGATK